MKLIHLTLISGLLLSACATAPSGPEPAWKMQATEPAQREAMWNFDGPIPNDEGWPGYVKCGDGIMGFGCNTKTISRGLKAKKLKLPQEYAAIYTDPSQVRAVEGVLRSTYIRGTVPADETGVFLASKYGQRYLRSSYVYTLADECGEKLSKTQKKQLSQSLTGDPADGIMPTYTCDGNATFNEKPLPVHTNMGGFDLDAAMQEKTS